MGSPPRMRGKRVNRYLQAGRDRITPADAGKTMHVRHKPKPLQDHPRGCGENLGEGYEINYCTGSPPRMRGKQIFVMPERSQIRITPADAGKTMPISMLSFVLQDHPRGCGENAFLSHSCLLSVGSPPRMRGKQLVPDPDAVGTGITPADAGKTVQVVRCKDCEQDHPRGCGEN